MIVKLRSELAAISHIVAHRDRGKFVAGAAILLSCLGSGAAHAQLLDNYIPSTLSGTDVSPGVTVASRLRPEYAPAGVRIGTVVIRPQADESVGYNDNVLGARHAVGSPLLNTQASVHGETRWTRNEVNLDVSVNDVRYTDLPTQSYTNWTAGGAWALEIGRDTLAVTATHFDLHQTPTGIDTIGVRQPVSYTVDDAKLSYTARLGRWSLVPAFDFAATRFDRTTDLNATLDNSRALDRNVETASLTTLYELAPQRSAVLVVRGALGQYLHAQPSRDYGDVAVLAGLDYNTQGVFRYRVLAGYEVRQFDSTQFKTHTSPIVEGSVIWTPTGLTTVTGTATRRIEDANETSFNAYTYTAGRLVIDHEYLRNVLLQARASVERADYLQGNATQTLYSAGATASWLLNRNIRLSASYDFADSEQNTRLSSYTRNIYLLQAHLAL